MRHLMLVAIPLFILSCSKETITPPNSASFTVLNSQQELSKKSYESKNVWVINDALGQPQGIKVMIGIGVMDKMQELELAFAIVKTFTISELNINPGQAGDFRLTGVHVQKVFKQELQIIQEGPWNITPDSQDGIYLSYLVGDERFTALPSVVVNNQEVHSIFDHTLSQSSNSVFDGKMNFDLYLQGTDGDYLHLKDGIFNVKVNP